MYDQYGSTAETADGSGPSGFGQGGVNFDPADFFRNVFGGGRGGFNMGDIKFDFGGDAGGNPFSSMSGAQLNIAVHLFLIYLTLQVSLEIDFLDAARGAEKTISFSRYEACAPCSGSGVSKGSKPIKCTTCKGSGTEYQGRGGFLFGSTCRTCGGAGKVNANPCTSCEGMGSVSRVATERIQIPSGKTLMIYS